MGDLPCEGRSGPGDAVLGRERVRGTCQPFSPPQLALAQENAATVAEAHAHDGGGQTRQPAPADARASNRRSPPAARRVPLVMRAVAFHRKREVAATASRPVT